MTEIDADDVARLCALRGLPVSDALAGDLVDPVRALLAQAANVRAALDETATDR